MTATLHTLHGEASSLFTFNRLYHFAGSLAFDWAWHGGRTGVNTSLNWLDSPFRAGGGRRHGESGGVAARNCGANAAQNGTAGRMYVAGFLSASLLFFSFPYICHCLRHRDGYCVFCSFWELGIVWRRLLPCSLLFSFCSLISSPCSPLPVYSPRIVLSFTASHNTITIIRSAVNSHSMYECSGCFVRLRSQAGIHATVAATLRAAHRAGTFRATLSLAAPAAATLCYAAPC
jgi:hypothetical protein